MIKLRFFFREKKTINQTNKCKKFLIHLFQQSSTTYALVRVGLEEQAGAKVFYVSSIQ